MSIAVTRPLLGPAATRSLVPLGRIAVGAAGIVLWQIASNAMGSEWLPGPAAVLACIWQLTVSGELVRDTLVTFWEAVAGMVLGGATGAALPFILRLSPRLMTALEPLISAGFGLPKLALAPLFILWFGIGITTKVVFVASIVFFLMFYNGLAGILSVDPQLIAMLRVAGASEWVISREVVSEHRQAVLVFRAQDRVAACLVGRSGRRIHRRRFRPWLVHTKRALAERCDRGGRRCGDCDCAGDGGECGVATHSGPFAVMACGRQGYGAVMGAVRLPIKQRRGRDRNRQQGDVAMMKVRAVASAAALIGALGLAVPAPASAAQMEDASIALPALAVLFLPVYVAEDRGIWKSLGLNVTLHQITGMGSTNAMLAGSVAFAVQSGQSLIRGDIRGRHMLGIALMADGIDFDLIAGKDLAKSINMSEPVEKRIAALKGKQVSTDAPNTVIDGVLRYLHRQSRPRSQDRHHYGLHAAQ